MDRFEIIINNYTLCNICQDFPVETQKVWDIYAPTPTSWWFILLEQYPLSLPDKFHVLASESFHEKHMATPMLDRRKAIFFKDIVIVNVHKL